MALETASYVANLVSTNPDGGDARSTADDHLRLIKACLRRTFPLIDSAVSLSAAQVMFNADLSASVQLQLNQLRDGTATANAAVVARYANSASLALYANSASYAAFAGQAASASYATLAATANSASYATTAGSATNATSAGNATTLGGLAGDTSAAVSTVAVRNASGHLLATYLNQNSSDSENPNVGSFFLSNGADGYLRKGTLAYVQTYLTTRNITGKTGIAKTLSTSAPSGGSDGDIHYRYT